jgi:hypothetical protein
MGYRSEVKSLIYGTNEEMQAFKLACFDLYNQVREDFNNELSDEENIKYKMLYLNLSYVKWYDEYDEVQRWQELLNLAQQAGLSTEFVRIGESSEGDLEQDYFGDDCKYYLSVNMSIDADF